MNLTASVPCGAPLDDVWRVLTDQKTIETLASARGIALQARVGTPLTWSVQLTLKDGPWHGGVILTPIPATWALSVCVAVQADHGQIAGQAVMDVRLRTNKQKSTDARVMVRIHAKSLSSKILLQSMTLARGRIEAQLREILNGVACDIEMLCVE